MRDSTIDRLSLACVVLVTVGILFAMIGDQPAALAACAIGAGCGLVASWSSPIKPWH